MTSLTSHHHGAPTEAERNRPPWDTPWGPADNVKNLGSGIFSVTTPGHGGLYIRGKAFRSIPKKVAETFMNGGHWAEEDCEMPIAMAVLMKFIDKDQIQYEFPMFMEEEEQGTKRIFELARNVCERYQAYRPCLEYLKES